MGRDQMMRLKSLYVKDFRSIDGEVNVSLDAPIVLIHGPNGAGKTSLLSAIELALTGGVPSMSRAEPDYMAYLPHKDRPFGEVRLELSAADGSLRSGEIKVTTAGVRGSPLLDAAEAAFFSERSYLAQSTLGRLLEIYQHSEKKADSPLTRFVKEILGLDRMEAMIGGLHSAGNIARLKVPVPAYGIAREEIATLEAAASELDRRQADRDTRIVELEQKIRERVAAAAPELDAKATTPAELSRILAADPEDQELRALIVAQREAEVARASLDRARTSPGGAERATVEASNQGARGALEDWNRANAAEITAILDQAAAFFADVPISSESGYGERAGALRARLGADQQRLQDLLSHHEQALSHRNEITRQLEEARVRLGRLEEQLSVLADSNESLARSLSDLVPHIHGENCPVCNRNFSEVSATPLAAYVADNVSAMIEQAGRLQSLVRDRSAMTAAIAQLEQQLAEAANRLLDDAELTRLKTRSANLTEVARQLDDATPRMIEGDRLRGEAARIARTMLSLESADQLLIVLRNSVEDLARRIDIDMSDDLTTDALIERVVAEIARRNAALTEKQEARRLAGEAAANLAKLRAEWDEAEAQRRADELRLTDLRRRKAEADKLIDLGKDLVRQTREARGRVVRRVLNDELNTVWRDLFVRLAPAEPFIPAFAIPNVTGADIEAVLETHHRRGGKGGNPRAMLSAGNLNTAALTLFLALHLSVKSRLPWLVIDDPVQSMDEVHISQFAALLRTLSKQMRRQVVIAVHERSLFDYLSLELSPAFEGDRLNVVEVGRNAVGQTVSRWDPKLFVKDKAIAA